MENEDVRGRVLEQVEMIVKRYDEKIENSDDVSMIDEWKSKQDIFLDIHYMLFTVRPLEDVVDYIDEVISSECDIIELRMIRTMISSYIDAEDDEEESEVTIGEFLELSDDRIKEIDSDVGDFHMNHSVGETLSYALDNYDDRDERLYIAFMIGYIDGYLSGMDSGFDYGANAGIVVSMVDRLQRGVL